MTCDENLGMVQAEGDLSGRGSCIRLLMLEFDRMIEREKTRLEFQRVCEGTPLNSCGSGGKRHDSNMHVLVSPQSLTHSDGSSSSTGTPAPLLWLDSGAFHHVVGDARILTDLRDPPARTVITVADGFQLPVTKVGVIQAPNIKISDVYLAPGLKMNLISVHQLAKSKIFTTFYEDHAEMWQKGEQIGGAIVDNDDVSLYRLRFLEPLHE